MTRAATLHRLRIRRSQSLSRQHHFTFRRFQRRLKTRSRLIRVMTFNTRQQTLPVRTILLQRVRFVIESDLAVLVRLAVLRQDHRFRLDLARLFLSHKSYTTKRQQQDEKDFHGRESYHRGMRKVGPE